MSIKFSSNRKLIFEGNGNGCQWHDATKKKANFWHMTLSSSSVNDGNRPFYSRLFTVPYFSKDRRCRLLSSTGRHLGLSMRAKLGRVQNARG